MLNIEIDYRLDTDVEIIDPQAYPDFVPIAKAIKEFLTNYPNETDYWEITNKKLARFLLN